MGRRAESLVLSGDKQLELERLVRVHSTSQQRALRARMILLLSSGLGVLEVSQVRQPGSRPNKSVRSLLWRVNLRPKLIFRSAIGAPLTLPERP